MILGTALFFYHCPVKYHWRVGAWSTEKKLQDSSVVNTHCSSTFTNWGWYMLPRIKLESNGWNQRWFDESEDEEYPLNWNEEDDDGEISNWAFSLLSSLTISLESSSLSKKPWSLTCWEDFGESSFTEWLLSEFSSSLAFSSLNCNLAPKKSY